MALSYNLGYQESLSVHPTRCQIFAGKPYWTFPNIWQWLIYELIVIIGESCSLTPFTLEALDKHKQNKNKHKRSHFFPTSQAFQLTWRLKHSIVAARWSRWSRWLRWSRQTATVKARRGIPVILVMSVILWHEKTKIRKITVLTFC